VIDDCNPTSATIGYPALSEDEAAQLNLPGWTGAWCGDVWKVIVHLRSLRKDVCASVLDCEFGIGLVKKRVPKNKLAYSKLDIIQMDYEDFERNRQELLDLKNVTYLETFLNELQ